MSDIGEAERLVQVASDLQEDGNLDAAERALLAAISAAPEWSVPHYNLGLQCKYQLRWEDSYRHNRRAAELAPGDEAANWNFGIAATALGRWADARRAWEACGIDAAPGDGAPEYEWGSTPVRLDPNAVGEVVWARRIDPARARILSVPLPSSHFRYQDVVLTDGAPEGERVSNGNTYPVFNVLQRLQPSAFETYVVELVTISHEAIEQLEAQAEALGGAAENWGTATRILCRECSYGLPHEHVGAEGVPAHPHCGLAATSSDHAQQILDAWLAVAKRVDVARWYAATLATT